MVLVLQNGTVIGSYDDYDEAYHDAISWLIEEEDFYDTTWDEYAKDDFPLLTEDELNELLEYYGYSFETIEEDDEDIEPVDLPERFAEAKPFVHPLDRFQRL